MNRLQKLLALVLTAVMICAAVPALAMTEDEYAAAAKIETTLADDYTGKTVILHSNDVHGAIAGYAYIVGLKKVFEDKGAEVILADVGDFSQGTPYVSTTKGETAIAMMIIAGYDVAALGNHEFDYGYAQLMNTINEATDPELENKTQFLCADIILRETGESMLDGHTILTTEGGLKLGFFGIDTPETATKVNPGLITEISFVFGDDLYAYAQAEIDALKEEGADLVIGLTHLGVDVESEANGYRSVDLYAHTTGADLLLDGHSHTVMTAGENGEPIQSAGTKFNYVGVVVIDNETKAIEDNFLMPAKTGAYEMVKDTETATWAQLFIDTVDEEYSAVFATSEVLLTGDRAPGNRTEETNLGDLITDAMVWSVVKEGGIEQVEPNQVVGITNGGGIRATIAVGDVTMKDVNTVL
ncbi:MAG: bifunctional metallophosphatase/5'-nucleotidase, partial [Clostridia bacterium]|nr:bifunctional metallophosphatase/5'-nucleotidase [Clostridia bacterium]